MNKKNAKREVHQHRKEGPALFIPAGMFLGFGIGFALNNIPAGLFVGLGGGFFLFAIARVFLGK